MNKTWILVNTAKGNAGQLEFRMIKTIHLKCVLNSNFNSLIYLLLIILKRD